MIAMTLENVTYAVFGPKSVKTLNELIKFQKMAERVGFEPTCRLPDKTLSRRPRYDHFGTSPNRSIIPGALATARIASDSIC